MSITRSVASVLFAVSILLGTSSVGGQDYPNRPIHIATTEAGGGSDFAARLIGQGLTNSLGQPVIVDNRGGAIIAIETVAKAAPDGYTLLLYSNSLWIAPFLQKVTYDPARDFAPVTWVSSAPNILVVHPTLPVKSVKELIALAKAKPGALNYASSGTGTSTHLAAELFKAMAGVNIMRISYKASTAAVNDLIGGQVQLMFAAALSVVPHIKSGRLKALAVTSAQPSALAPGLPTVAASGVPGYESATTYGVLAPAKTPTAVINKLNEEIVRILNRPDVKEKFFISGAEVVGASPEQFSAKIKSETARVGKTIQDAGIRVE